MSRFSKAPSMRFFKKKPAPEAALVQQLTDQLKHAEEQNCTLQKQLLMEQQHSAALQMALEEALDNSRSIQQKMDIKTTASKLQAEALREKLGELALAKDQIQSLLQERTHLNAYLCLQNTKIYSLQDQLETKVEMFKMVNNELKSSYGQLKVTTTRLEAQNRVSRQALDQKEQETTALQSHLREERERSEALQEELNKLQLLIKSAEEEKAQSEKNMEEMSKEVTLLQNELKEEQRRNLQLQEEMTLYKELKRSAEDLRVHAENSMGELSRELKALQNELNRDLTALQNELKEEKDLNKELQSKLCISQAEKQAPQIQNTTIEPEKVLTKTEGGPQSRQIQTEDRQGFIRHTRIVLTPKH